MRKVNLRMNEEQKYNVIKRLVDSNGNKLRACIQLQCSLRTINRMIIKYNEEGKAAFIHGNRNRKPVTTYTKEFKEMIQSLYTDTYFDCNIQHFSELIEMNHDYKISPRTLLNWLKEIEILSPKARRFTKRELRKKLKRRLKGSNKKDSVKIGNSIANLIIQKSNHAIRGVHTLENYCRWMHLNINGLGKAFPKHTSMPLSMTQQKQSSELTLILGDNPWLLYGIIFYS